MIRNVIAVYRLQCSQLVSRPSATSTNAEYVKEHGERLEIVVPAKLSINNKVVDKNHVFEYQLVFRSCQELEVTGHWVYVLVFANAKSMMIGTGCRPYPVTVSSQTLPSNLTDSQLTEVTVTYAERSQLPVFP